jgi:hypothetical protein
LARLPRGGKAFVLSRLGCWERAKTAGLLRTEVASLPCGCQGKLLSFGQGDAPVSDRQLHK